MKGTMLVIATDGSIQRRELTDPTNLLPVLQKEVGGYIEVVPYFSRFLDESEMKRCVVLCNENGKLDGLPYNALATALWQDELRKLGGSIDDVLVGPVLVIMGDKEFMDEF